jgi:eukaryotic-like serine/threonine-protein kinase
MLGSGLVPAEDALPKLLNGRYRLEGTLGEGGMGVVYRGTDLMMQRAVAVKLIRGSDGYGFDDEIAGRFLREAKNTARLQHEHIVEVFDLGRTNDGDLYFVMELLEGESLASRIRKFGRLSPEETVHIARQICKGLHVAHVAGVVHRDLKPANIMLLRRAGDPLFVKVLDFGVAKAHDPDQQTQFTHTGMLVGTVDYMAPEQITGKPVDGRTDIYSLGVLLYRMLSGRPPFKDTGVPALIHAHLNTMPKPITEVVSDVPNALDFVVLRCLAKSPGRRYESMAELARALEDALGTDEEDPEEALTLLRTTGGRAAQKTDPPKGAMRKRYPSDEETVARSGRSPLTDEDATMIDPTLAFDEATIKLDRPSSPPPARMGSTPRVSSRICVVCTTVNYGYAPACTGCGSSLLPEDQARLRPAPPAFSGPYPAYPPAAPSAPSPMQPWAPPPPPPPSIWQRFLTWTGLRSR